MHETLADIYRLARRVRNNESAMQLATAGAPSGIPHLATLEPRRSTWSKDAEPAPSPADPPEHVREKINSIPELRFVWDEAPIGLAFVTPTGHFSWVNQYLAQFLGYDQLELVGMHFAQVTAGTDVHADIEAFRDVIDGRRDSYQMNKLYNPKIGPPKPGKLTVKKSPVQGEAGLLVFATVLPIDAFEAAGVSPNERKTVLKEAIGELVIANWKAIVILLLAGAGVANIGEIFQLITGGK